MIQMPPSDAICNFRLDERAIERFQAILASKNVDAFVRRPRGRDIYAACGQLAARTSTSKLVQIAA